MYSDLQMAMSIGIQRQIETRVHADRMPLDTVNSHTEQKPFRKLGSLDANALVSGDESTGDPRQPMCSFLTVYDGCVRNSIFPIVRGGCC